MGLKPMALQSSDVGVRAWGLGLRASLLQQPVKGPGNKRAHAEYSLLSPSFQILACMSDFVSGDVFLTI